MFINNLSRVRMWVSHWCLRHRQTASSPRCQPQSDIFMNLYKPGEKLSQALPSRPDRNWQFLWWVLKKDPKDGLGRHDSCADRKILC